MAATNTTTQATTTTQTNTRTGAATNTATSPTTPATASTPAQTGNPLADWLAGFLPASIDFQDIGIRVGLVVLGAVLIILVAWAFLRGKTQQTVNVSVPPQTPAGTNASEASEAEEAAMVA